VATTEARIREVEDDLVARAMADGQGEAIAATVGGVDVLVSRKSEKLII